MEQAWQQRGPLACLLWPLSMLYRILIAGRRMAYRHGVVDTTPVTLPVVVVGNLSVGGTGKTPLCNYLVQEFQAAGWRPAIVSRGYGGQRHEQPHLVGNADTPAVVGDEPLMLFEQSGVPVCVCIKRAYAVQHLASHTDADIVFADDGLQHLAMPRVAEIVVLDAKRGFGNGWLLPAGPLREPASRLNHADLIVLQTSDERHASLPVQNMHEFHLRISKARALSDERIVSLNEFVELPVIAMAGIGHPMRFFDALRAQGLRVVEKALPDHHVYTLDDLQFDSSQAVLVTSKDAVKLRALGELPVEVFEVSTTLVASESLQQAVSELELLLRNKLSIKRP